MGGSGLPTRFGLRQNYPNPFNPGTVIPYQLAADGYVRLEVFNLLGQRVATLVEGEMTAGAYTAVWDARDGSGYGVAAGVYVYRLTAGDATATRRMVLVDGPAGGPVSVAGPVRAADVATDATEYGLTVSGVGLATYVDAAFVVGVGPVAVGVEASTGSAGVGSAGRGKAAAGGILGDVDGDGRVDVADALVVAAYSVYGMGWCPRVEMWMAMDRSMGRMRGCWLCIASIRVIRGCRRGLGCRWRWLGALRAWYVGAMWF